MMCKLLGKKCLSFLVFAVLLGSTHSHIFAQTAISSSSTLAGKTTLIRPRQQTGDIETCITGYVRSAGANNKDYIKSFDDKFIPDIQVDLLDVTGISVIQTLTNEQGFFSFRCPRPGAYYLNLPNHWSLDGDMSDPAAAWRAVEASDCQNTIDIEITLPPQERDSGSCLSSYQHGLYQNNIQMGQCTQHMLFLPVILR